MNLTRPFVGFLLMMCVFVTPIITLSNSLENMSKTRLNKFKEKSIKKMPEMKSNSVSNLSFGNFKQLTPSSFKANSKIANGNFIFSHSENQYSFYHENRPNIKGLMDKNALDNISLDVIQNERDSFLLKVNLQKLPNSKYPQIFMSGSFNRDEGGNGILSTKAFLSNGQVLDEITTVVPKPEMEATLANFNNSDSLANAGVAYLKNISGNFNLGVHIVIVITIPLLVAAALTCASLFGYCAAQCLLLTPRNSSLKAYRANWCINCECEYEQNTPVGGSGGSNKLGFNDSFYDPFDDWGWNFGEDDWFHLESDLLTE